MRGWKLMIALGLLLGACSSESKTDKFAPPPVPVLTADVKAEDVPVYVESIGVLKPVVTVEVRPQVNGQLIKAYISEGQLVRKGERLFEVDSQTYAIKLQEAEAQLVQDQASLDTAQRKLERHQRLAQQDLISQQEWDELKAQVAKSQGQVQADRAKVAAARLDLERCTIVSPVEGRAGKLLLHSGNLVTTIQSQPLVVLSQVDPLVVDFTLTEREYRSLKPEHRSGKYPIELSAFGQPEERTKGTLTFLDTSFEAQTGLLPMRGSIPNPVMQFMPGQSVRVYLPIALLQGAKLVPQKAVKINQQGPYVFIVKADQTVELRQVILGDERGESVIVNEGVSPGEIVVTDGHLRLAPGLKVEIKTGSGQP